MTREAAVLDHIGLDVGDYDVSKAFYRQALAPLGIELLMEFPGVAGFGEDVPGLGPKPYFWIRSRRAPQTGLHVAFAAGSRELVHAFHQAALAAGGRDNGEPGLRMYHTHYYGAFVLDPDANNVEAVCHLPE
jgi:catechol 2,3-dioxygenase-like lactoylglutathione lyase family enzyme